MLAGPPPPPPPPPPMSGQLPPMRINTTENVAAKKAQIVNNDVYEPPAAIQNAMLTKDKKPFTYTPGMGGKLDLSQIRSPRMARRVAKNANDEGIEGPPKLAVESKSSSIVAPTAANFLLQPQVAVPVFPSNMPAQAHVNRMSSSQFINRTPSNAADKQAEPSKNITKIDTKAVPINTPESPSTPTQVTLAKAPTPWLQNKNKPQEELPEWAKRACINKVVSSGPSECVPSSPVYLQVQQSLPQHSETKQKQGQKQHLISLSQQPKSQQQKQNISSAMSQQVDPQPHEHEHVIPIRIEDRPSVFDVKRDSGHHQFKQPPTLHHQQRWGQMPSQYTLENQAQNCPQDQEQSQIRIATLPRLEQPVGTTYIIPLVVKDGDKKTAPSNVENNLIEKAAKIVQQRNPNSIQQHEAGPVQSRSFRVLQKITDTDAVNDVGTEQIRKLELSEDERLLMNKFKEQVDHETYLHQEEDPRYRGAAIPSRAFRFLQNMTDSNDATVTCAASRNIQNVASKKQNRNSKLFEETQTNLPPSEQQVQEPKKYMGSAIPSRSFRILQAMTAPEGNAMQENRQADYTCRTENNLPGNQQSIFLPLQPIPFWYPEGWWGYYPVQHNAEPNKIANEMDRHSFPFYAYPNGRTYVGSFYPVCNENFADVMTQMGVTSQENPPGQYAGYAAVIYPQAGYNDVQPTSHIVQNKCNYIDNHFTTADSFFSQNDKLDFVLNGTVNESKNTVLPKINHQINHLDAQSNDTYSSKSVSENFNTNIEKNCITTAMNIIDEEDSISTDNSNNIAVTNNIEMPGKKTFGPYINVPNYTYVDTSESSASSDSNDSSDSSDSTSDNEQLLDSCQKNHNRSNDTISNNTSSDNDSDSYIAYSSMNPPYGKLEKDACNFPSNENRTDIAAACSTYPSTNNLHGCSRDFSENCNHTEEIRFSKEHIDYSDDRVNSHAMSFQQDTSYVASERCNDENSVNDRNDLDSYSSKSTERHSEQCHGPGLTTDSTVFHAQLDVDRENVKQPDSETPYYTGKKDNKAFFEVTDDPPDTNVESTMVSVSLPLRFKFFVSEDNEDITTVIVGDSEIKAEKSCEYSSMKDDVCVDFHVGNDTSVDFTVKAHLSDVRNKARSIESSIPHVDFTLRKDSMGVSGVNCGKQNLETRIGHGLGINSAEPTLRDTDDYDTVSESIVVTRDTLLHGENCDYTQAESTCNNNVESIAFDRTADDKHDRCIDQDLYRTQNVKLIIQGPREDTDDEDSGVTSDISRMISEIDTDSDCTCSKNVKKYQRTQTHSRLFRLLNDDSIPTLSSYPKIDISGKKSSLSLPLKMNAFNYDDNHCSNYSSGLTSPEYSPIHEQSWRRYHEDSTTNTSSLANSANVDTYQLVNQREQNVFSKDDSYFQDWKSPKLSSLREQDVVPSLAFKTVDSKIPSWTYKVNVLCPRIKSTKSVPQTLLARHSDKTTDPSRMIPSIPTSCTNSKTSYC
ncbi:hypothetical protein ACFW04_002960 [Cataglyphis niger]